MALLFQYGSNCSEDQINGKDRLRGDAKFICIARTVADFQLAFNVWSAHRSCAAADIVPMARSKVWGALYDVPDYLIQRDTAQAKGRRSMDNIEAEGVVYKRGTIEILRQDNGHVIRAITYQVIHPQSGLETSLEYVGYIIKGLRERGVDMDYIAEVKHIAAVNNPKIARQVEGL